MKIYPFGQFTHGLVTKLPPNQIPDGASADGTLNWITIQGKLELNRGYAILGTTVNSGSRCSGLRVGKRADGTNVAYGTYDRKVRYYNDAVGDWTEIGSDMLPAAASGEDVSLEFFESVAGKQIWLNSPNTGPYKFNVANPGDAISMYDSSKNYKGWIRVLDNQAYLWNIDNFDRTSVRLSYVEVRGRADYTLVTAEAVGTGNASSKTFSGVFATKAGNAKLSFLDVTMTDSNETFSDSLNGTLIGSLGGTGTVNYQTGVYSITFNSAPANLAAITTTYRSIDETGTWTPSGGALSGSIANFIVPAARVSGQPNVFQQAKGGNVEDIVPLKDNKFCFHQNNIWDILTSLDDTKTTNTVFRSNTGIQRMRGAYSAPEGIYQVDTSDVGNQRFVLVSYSSRTTDIKPVNLSPNLDLSNYIFDKAVVFPFNDYVLFTGRSLDSPDNNRTFLYSRIYRTWDILDYCISCADVYNNGLIAGDSISPNVQQLFSGFDANGDVITNQWISGISRLGFITPRGKPRVIYGQKKAKKVYLEGYIASDQILHMYASIDRGDFVEILDSSGNPFIQGSGAYVDKSQSVNIGADLQGDHTIGGSGSTNTVQANHYARYLDFGQDRFEEVQIKFVAGGIGYLSIIRLEFRDIRVLQDKPSSKYRV